MTRLFPILLVMLAGCSAEQPVAVDNAASVEASMPIGVANEVAAAPTGNVTQAVSRETDAPPPTMSPSPSPAPQEDRYRAIGTEPFWAVTVRGSVATLERPDRAAVRYAVSRNDDKRAIRYLGDGFAMTVTEGPCSDGMSDAVWSDRVALAFGEGTLNGCGGVRDDGADGRP